MLAAYAKATQLDPRNANLFSDLGGQTLKFLRRYPEAVEAYSHALVLAPDVAWVRVQIGWTYAVWTGELDTLRTELARMPRELDLGPLGSANAHRALMLLVERKPDSLLVLLGTARLTAFGSQGPFLPTALYAGWAHRLRGEGEAAEAAFHSARVQLDSVVALFPDDWRVHAARGLALAGLGRRQEALREARWLEQSVVYRQDAFSGTNLAESRAQILAQAGELDAALDQIEQLLAGPGFLTVHLLRLDPRWDPLRDNARFQALLAKYEN